MSRSATIITLIMLLVLIAIGTGAWYGWNAWSAFKRSGDLRSALLLTTTMAGGGTLYQWDGKQFSELTDAKLRVESAAHVGANIALITRGPDDASFDVVLNGKTVYSSNLPKRGISLSPNGQVIAFGEFTGAQGTTTASTTTASTTPNAADPHDAAAWRTVVLDTMTGASTTYASSFSPYLLDDTHLVRFTPSGLIGSDVRAQSHGDVTYNADPFPDALIHTSLAPDRADVAWTEPDGKAAIIFWFPSLPQKEKVRVISMPLSAESSFSLSDTGFYEIRYRNGGSEAWVRTLTDPKNRFVYKFPDGIKVERILF